MRLYKVQNLIMLLSKHDVKKAIQFQDARDLDLSRRDKHSIVDAGHPLPKMSKKADAATPEDFILHKC